MDIYRPNVKPPEPGVYANGEQARPIPGSMWRDNEIRRAMEYALRLTYEDQVLLQKYIEATAARPLFSIRLSCPYVAPPLVASGDKVGSHNDLLKDFAFEAYDLLDAYFDGEWSNDWCIAAYKDRVDESNTFRLGVFLAQDFQ